MTSGLKTNQIGRSEQGASHFLNFLAVIAGLGLAFQVGHFLEHALQFSVWVSGTYEWVVSTFCGRDTPFMSTPLNKVVAFAGGYLFPEANRARQMMLGMELLHLVGNSIFLATIGMVYYLIPNKWARYAIYIEGAHLCEHISLTISAYYVGTPIGLSTMFGQASYLWGKEAVVGWRVSWHFFMNLLPMPLVMMAIMQYWSEARKGSQGASVPMQVRQS